jgi:hypothetical protein
MNYNAQQGGADSTAAQARPVPERTGQALHAAQHLLEGIARLESQLSAYSETGNETLEKPQQQNAISAVKTKHVDQLSELLRMLDYASARIEGLSNRLHL